MEFGKNTANHLRQEAIGSQIKILGGVAEEPTAPMVGAPLPEIVIR